jgi:PilZ domain
MEWNNRRKLERHQVDICGTLMWASGTRSCNCIIKDLSEEGASIDAVDAPNVPNIVFLLVDSSQSVFDCEVRWRNHALIGLRFLDASTRAIRNMLIRNQPSRPVQQLTTRYKLTSLKVTA